MSRSGPLRFEIRHDSPSCGARLGAVTTLHGKFDTPAFMPVGTKGTIKGILPSLVEATGAQIILNNTYHLLLRPGPELVASLGGVHRFMNWPRPILTDSGGYQAFSMSDTNRIDDDGVTFKSIVDGSMIRLTPERAIQVQNLLGADIIMAFDDCPPAAPVPGGDVEDRAGSLRDDAEDAPRARNAGPAAPRNKRSLVGNLDHRSRLEASLDRTARWLERCDQAHARPDEQSLFGIVQGGTDLSLRSRSIDQVCGVELPGYAIGGVAVGESSDDIARVVEHAAPRMPRAKPRYLMGVGYERDILAAVRAGVDMFDCVLPTRNGRNAFAFTSEGPLKLRNAAYGEDVRPLEPGCDCHACSPTSHGWMVDRPFTRAYLRHLFMAEEMLGPVLVSLHNLRHFQRFMADIRATIVSDDWKGLILRWPVASSGLKSLA
ncbi:MAG: tRNA guanosine(34) transglycosylase Tgt [Planctomycetota bacterium]|nr:tRNA guanosine(34) transglycosylase Tgt [Planctomycetota bacterium]